jgi:hypothetical protein
MVVLVAIAVFVGGIVIFAVVIAVFVGVVMGGTLPLHYQQ